MTNLALALSDLGRATGEIEPALQAVGVAQAASSCATAVPSHALRALTTWGRLAAEANDWRRAAGAFGRAMGLLPMAVPRNLTRLDLEHQLQDIAHLVGDAVAAAIEIGEPESAMEYLEQGRAVLLTYAFDSRLEVPELREQDPELADEWERLRDQIDGVTSLAEAGLHPEQRFRVLEKYNDLIARIRTIPGMERFMAPASIAELRTAAMDGPIINLNVSEYRCDALILTPAKMQVVPLPEIKKSILESRVSGFLKAIRQIEDEAATSDDRRDAEAEIHKILAWLWDGTVSPIMDALGYIAAPSADQAWPHIWWSPTDLFSFLPLHAAGHHREDHRTTLDRVISSYTPSIRALGHVRQRPAAGSAPLRLLSVGLPDVPGVPPLPGAEVEAQRVADLTGGEQPLTSARANRGAVLTALHWATWTHLACHTRLDLSTPSASGLLLRDGLLSVTELSELNLDRAELAYLSACSTARGDRRLVNESIHIASAFQIAGYRDVIATLWTVLDETSTDIADGFYRALLAEEKPAKALHLAVRRMREEYPNFSSVWAAYIHVGA